MYTFLRVYFNILIYVKTTDNVIFKSRELFLRFFKGFDSGSLNKGLPASVSINFLYRLPQNGSDPGSGFPTLNTSILYV